MKEKNEDCADDLFADLEKELMGATNEKDIIVAVLIDTSGSMSSVTTDGSGKSRTRIDGACDGLISMMAYCRGVPVLKRSVLLGVGWFGDKVGFQTFQRVDRMKAPRLQSAGGTPLGDALIMALDAIQTLVCKLDDDEGRFSIPNLCIISDGEPNHNSVLDAAVKRAAKLVQNGDLNLSLIGIDRSDCERLKSLGLPGKAYSVSEVSWEDAIVAATLSGGGTARPAAI
jgi:uncharacterized protein YegL